MTVFSVSATIGGVVPFVVDTFPNLATETIYVDTPVMFSVSSGGPFAATSLLSGIDFVRDISCTWDFDDTGATFQFNPYDTDANSGYGLCTMKAWSTPGTYNVVLTARTRTGVQTQIVQVVVEARPTPDKLYAVSFAGNFTDAPAGATQISSWAAFVALSNTFGSDQHVEFHFRAGETFLMEDEFLIQRTAGRLHVLLDTYGTGDRAILKAATQSFRAWVMFRLRDNVHLVSKVDMDGSYNVFTGKYTGGHVTGFNARTQNSYVAVVGCEHVGLAESLLCEAGTSWAGYDFKGGDAAAYSAFYSDGGVGAATTWGGMSGCELYYSPLALRLQDGISGTSDPDASQGACVRVNSLFRFVADNFKIRGHIGFSSFGGTSADAATQPALRLHRGGSVAGHLYSITRGDITGNAGGVYTQYPLTEPIVGDGRYVIDRLIHTSAGTPFRAALQICAGGVIQNVSSYYPNTYETGGVDWIAYVTLNSEDGSPAEILEQPVLVRAVTLVSDRSSASGGLGILEDFNGTGWTGQDITVVDCMMHAPNHATGVDLEPLSRGDNFAPRTGAPFGNASNPPVYDIDGTLRGETTLQGAHDAVKANVAVSAVTHSGDAPTIAKITAWEPARGVYALTAFGTGYANEDFYLIENNWTDNGVQFGSNGGRTWAIDDSRMGTPTGPLQNNLVLTNKSGVRLTVPSNSLTIT